MNYTSTLGAIAAAAAWAVSGATTTTSRADPDDWQSNETAGVTCPVSGQRSDGGRAEPDGVGRGAREEDQRCPFTRWPTSEPEPESEPDVLVVDTDTATATITATCDPASAELDIPDVPPLTDAQKDVIKATAPVLGVHGVAITTRFYDEMLAAHPELKNVFSDSSQKLGHQPRALASAVHAYATNIHDLAPVLPIVERIAHKHASLHIVAAQYGIVGKHLIEAIGAVLGEALTPEIADAWYHGYWNLAKVFIQRERELYDAAQEAGGWEGFRPLRVARRERESDEITSFYFEHKNGGRVPPHTPGQYIAISVPIPALGHRQARQYSLSDCSNGRYFRISVKRETGESGGHPGCVSNTLHSSVHPGDTVLMTSPYGDFSLDTSTLDPTAPLVLISAGVGQTPLIAMLNAVTATLTAATATGPPRPISYITIARDAGAHAFHQHCLDVASQTPGMAYRWFHSSVRAKEGKARVTMAEDGVRGVLHLGNARAEYFICGPAGFMKEKQGELEELGVDRARIHVELFAAGGLE